MAQKRPTTCSNWWSKPRHTSSVLSRAGASRGRRPMRPSTFSHISVICPDVVI